MNTGDRFGSLVLLQKGRIYGEHHIGWLCQCDCGRTKTIRAHSLRSGNTRTCGHGRDNAARERACGGQPRIKGKFAKQVVVEEISH